MSYNNFMKLKNLEIKSNVFLAPMAGYTDVGFRRLCAKFGAGITYTEMVSAKAMLFDSEKTKDLLITEDQEKIKAIQIFGHEPLVMQKACQNPLLDKFDIIDINMGCPAPKIVKNHEGSFLLTNKTLAGDIVKACVDATDKPVTVKMRLGFNNDNVAVDFAREMEKAGASMITVHGRTQSQMYSGKVDLESIKKVKQALTIPVVANGDVVDLASFNQTLETTGADAVMIGRGSLGNPTLFAEILEKKFDKKYLNKYNLISEHIGTLQKYFNDRFINLNMRKHIAFYLKNTGADSGFKQRLMVEEDIDKVLAQLKDFFEKLK